LNASIFAIVLRANVTMVEHNAPLFISDCFLAVIASYCGSWAVRVISTPFERMPVSARVHDLRGFISFVSSFQNTDLIVQL
jgi:uncharacterized membrane protein